MMQNDKFDAAIKVVLEHEGQLSDNRLDPGGVTNFGISLRFLIENHIDINLDGKSDRKDILSMTKEDAICLYKEDFWDKYNIDEIDSHSLAIKLFDLCVNLGGKQAIKLLQISINQMNELPIEVDGDLANITLFKVNHSDPNKLLYRLKVNAEHFYINLVADHPNLAPFLPGWLNRAKS